MRAAWLLICLAGCAETKPSIDENEAYRRAQKEHWAKVDAQREEARLQRLDAENARDVPPQPIAVKSEPSATVEQPTALAQVKDTTTPECREYVERKNAESKAWREKLRALAVWQRDNCVVKDNATGYETHRRQTPTGQYYDVQVANAGSSYDCSKSKPPAELTAARAQKDPIMVDWKRYEACIK